MVSNCFCYLALLRVLNSFLLFPGGVGLAMIFSVLGASRVLNFGSVDWRFDGGLLLVGLGDLPGDFFFN